jgi:lambda family phage portal protein
VEIANNIAQKLGFVPIIKVEEIKKEQTELLTSKMQEVAMSYEHELSLTKNDHQTEIGTIKDNLQRLQADLSSQRSFAGAQTTHLTNDWNNVFETLSGMQRVSLRRLVGRSRDFALNDPYAKNYLRALDKNVIGPDGFTLRNKAMELVWDAEKRQNLPRYDKVANMIIQDGFEEWQLPRYNSLTEDIAFREQCSLILKTIATDGEILVKPIRTVDNKFRYTLQLIECDYLDETKNGTLPNGNIIIMGVEMTSYRKPVAYWLRKSNPYQAMLYSSYSSGEHERIPIYDKYGQVQIKHLFVKEHPSQIRGIPWFAPSMIRLKMLSGFEEAILVDARSSANKGLIYEYKDGSGAEGITAANVGGGAFVPNDANGKPDPSRLIRPSLPGQDVVTPQGMTAKVADFKSPSGMEGGFQKWALRGIAAGIGIAYITLANDYEAVNYTSSRTNLLDERDTWKTLHTWFRDHFLNWNFEEWLRAALMNGAINLPVSKFDKFNKPWFQGRAWQWVSPKDEADAIMVLVSNGAASFEEFLAERGWSLEAFIDQMQYEKRLFEEAGLPFPGSNYKQVKPIEPTPEPAPKNGKAVVVQN